MNLTAFSSTSQRRIFGSALLVFWLAFLSLLAPVRAQAPTPTPAPTWKKVRSAAPPFYAKRMEIGVSTDSTIQIREDKPGYKEIDAEARIALRIVGEDDDAIIRPFWLGQADFSSSATKRLPNGSRADIYDPQKYLWTVAPGPAIPIAQPVELHPAMSLVAMGASAVNPILGLKLQWDTLYPWAKTTIKLAAQEAVGLEETAIDGRPLGQLKTNVSRPDKHFYWDFGESQDEFPHTTSAQVAFTKDDDETAAIGPAKAVINWHLPTRTIYDVEMGLWNWTTSEDADAATFEEWANKILEDPELQKEIALDVGLEIVSLAAPGAGKMATSGGKVIFRVVLKNKASARVVESGFLTATTRAVRRADGSLVPAPAWQKTHKIQTVVKDSVRRRESKAVTVLKKAGAGAAQDAAKDAIEESIDDDDVPEEEQEKDRDDETETFIDGGELYLYSGSSNYNAGYWDGATSSIPNPTEVLYHHIGGDWPPGFYLTDMPPSGLNSASNLSAGQHSFALFGHPYVNTIHWTKIKVGEITQVTTINGVEQPPQPVESAMPKQRDYSLKGKDDGTPYHDWNYKVYVYTSPNNTINPQRVIGQGSVSFQGSGKDIPDGNIDTTPKEANTDRDLLDDGFGTWDGATGNSGWMPRGEDARAITGGQRVPFEDNYANFSQWSIFSMSLDPLQTGNQDKGTSWDFKRARQAFALDRNLRDANGNSMTGDGAITEYINELRVADPNNPGQHLRESSDNSKFITGYTWHHNRDMRTMELVASALHNDALPHQGGASWARKARW